MAIAAAVAIADGRETSGHTADKVTVGGTNSRVDDVCRDAGTCLRARISSIKWQGTLVDAVQPPRQRGDTVVGFCTRYDRF
jgi:hypothetical protein